jgi:hypothetical protein
MQQSLAAIKTKALALTLKTSPALQSPPAGPIGHLSAPPTRFCKMARLQKVGWTLESRCGWINVALIPILILALDDVALLEKV